jgi:hypothetical protein
MIKRSMSALLLLLLVACSSAEKTPAPSASTGQAVTEATPLPISKIEAPTGAKVFFVEPKDGADIKGPAVDGKVKVSVKMGVENIDVKPAGELVQGTGHHHIIVDADGIALAGVVPKDETHIHFGKGQTEAELELPPGKHKLTLQFADGMHMSYGPALSSTINITVAAQ